jgi:hypothetical protein
MIFFPLEQCSTAESQAPWRLFEISLCLGSLGSADPGCLMEDTRWTKMKKEPMESQDVSRCIKMYQDVSSRLNI